MLWSQRENMSYLEKPWSLLRKVANIWWGVSFWKNNLPFAQDKNIWLRRSHGVLLTSLQKRNSVNSRLWWKASSYGIKFNGNLKREHPTKIHFFYWTQVQSLLALSVSLLNSWSFCFELIVLNESEYSLSRVRYAFGNELSYPIIFCFTDVW